MRRLRVDFVVGGRYVLRSRIASGGMADVWEALDERLQRLVAVKVMRPDSDHEEIFRVRFRDEALHAAGLLHTNIATVFDYGEDDGLAYLVMERVDGRTLGQVVRDEGPVDPDRVRSIIGQAALALGVAHEQRVVHRDVKPANILLHDDGGWPFLTDFGIATLRTSEHSRSEVYKGFGTPAFMSPEQALGRWDADFRTDVYSLGLVAYRALAGRLPFTGETAVALAAQRTVKDAPPIRSFAPEVHPVLAAIIDRCLARDPRKRWRSSAALRDALKRFRALPDGPALVPAWLSGLFRRAQVAPSLLGQAASWGAIGLWLRR